MKFDIKAARSAGYSDDEIAEYLASENKFDLGGALSSGYSASDVIDYLTQSAEPAPAAPAPVAEGPSFTDRVRESAGQFGDTMAKLPGGLGMIGTAISGIAREQAPAAPAQPAQKPAPQPTPYRDRREALDDAVNLLEEGFDQAKVAESFAQGGITFNEIVAHGQKRGSEYFKQQPAAPVDPEVASLARRFPAPVTGQIRGVEPTAIEEVGNLVTRGIETGGRNIDVLRNRAGLGMSDEFLATRIAQRQRRIEAARPGTSLQDDMQAIADAGDKGLFEAATAIAQNPTATLAMIAESVIATAPAAAASVGGFLINPLAGTAAAFGSGAAMEYGATIVDTMIDAGMNPSDPASVARALANPELMAKAEERGLKRGLTVGAFSALTAGVASRFAKPILQAVDKGQIGRAAGLSAGAAGTGIVGDSVGEAAAQTVVGDPLNYSDILIEGLAGGPGSIADVGGASIAAARNDPARQIAREIDNAVFNFTPETNLTAQAGLAPIVVPNIGAANVSTPDLAGPATTAGGQLPSDLGSAGLGDAGLAGVDAGGAGGVGTDGLVPVGGATAPLGGAARQPSAGVGLERVAPRATDSDLLARTEASIASQENNNANTQPVEQWFGRKGDGYVTQADAQQAIGGRQRMFPTLDWQVEQMPNGKFRLAGYAATQQTGAQNAATITPTTQPQQGQEAAQALTQASQETTLGTQTTQAQQAETQGQETLASSGRQSELGGLQPRLPDAEIDELSRLGDVGSVRTATQEKLNVWAAQSGEQAPRLNTPDAEAEAGVTVLGNLFGQVTGLGQRVVAYSDPGGVNGFALGKIAFVNTAFDSNSVDAPRTVLHELRHVVEQIAKADTAAGLTNTPAQQFTASMDSIFDDMDDAGKRAYIVNFIAKDELAAIKDPAKREARIAELMQSPLLRSEMLADFLGNRSQDRDFLIDLANQDPQGFEGFVKKWLAVIDNLIAKLRGGKTQGQKESAKVDKYVRDLNKAKMVARDALIAFRKGNIGQQAQAQTQVEGESLAASGRQVYDRNITGVINGRSTDAETGQGIPAIAAADGPVSGRDGRGQIPAYGRAREGSISVVGRHYSTQERATLNGAFYGRGLKGAERTRLDSSSDSRLRSRIYFYVDQGAGIRPESGVGGFAHEVQLNNVYDPATKLVGPQADINAFESAVIDAGFDGYIAPFGNNQSAVVLLGPKHLAVPVRSLGRVASAPAPQAEAPTTVKRGLLSRELNAINTDNIAGARISGGSLVVPADQTQAANAELERIGSDIRFSKTQRVVGTASIEENFKLAQSRNWQKGRDLKLEMQQRVLDAAMAAGVDVSVDSPAAREYLREIGMADALVALKQNPNAIGWYDLKTRQALATMALVHPEIGRDENARFAFTWALAVTSNGLKVGKNFELAEKTYEAYKRDGRMPNNIGVGTAGGQINLALDLFNELKDAWGMDNLRKFMQTNFTVSEITGISKALKPGGEHADVVVKGASILGPKIGNGFFSNLYGNFDSLTMDRWLVRTWGRWTATLIKPMPEQTAKARDRLSTNIAKILKDPAEAQRLSGLIDAEITSDVDVDVLAGAVQKASMDPQIRTKLNESEVGLELRKAGNSLAKYLDGQKEAPANPDERKYIRAIFGDVLSDLRKLPEYKDLTMADLQAVLWYAEKRLYETAKTQADQNVEEDAVDEDVSGYADDEAPDYANAAASVAREKGVSDRKINATLKRIENERSRATRPADQAGDGEGQTAGAGQPAAAGGFTRQEKRQFIGERAVLRARADRAGDAQQPGAYTRGRGEDGGRVRVLKSLGVSYTDTWKIAKPTSTVFRANDIAAPEFLQLARTPENAAKFQAAISENKAAHPYGAAVYVYSPEEYQAMRLLLSTDGTSGVAIKPDGDIVSVFSTAGAGRAVMELAVSAGGRKLDAFETVLPEFYAPHGFRAVARTRWNDEFAPAEWNKDTFRKYNNGEPDVVFMVYDPAKMDAEYSPKDGRVMQGEDGYDRAVAAQTREMRKVARDNELPDVPAFSKRETNALGLYSELAVKLDAGPAQAMGEQWMAYIKGLTTKGVKQDEITWSGVEEWIKLQDGKIKKQDIVDYVKANGVQVEEVVLGGPEPELTGRSELGRLYDEAIEIAMGAEVSTNPEYIRSLDPEDRAPEEQDLLDAYDAVNENPEESALYERARPTKYEQYTLPGGENYREVLITLPTKKEKWVMRQAEDGRWEVLLSDGSRSLGFFKTEGSAGSELAYANRSAGESQKNQYRSSHWTDPNVVAHLRLNDRVAEGNGPYKVTVRERGTTGRRGSSTKTFDTMQDAQRFIEVKKAGGYNTELENLGKVKVLFVEELQSDWGQEGKKKGFSTKEKAEELIVAQREAREIEEKRKSLVRSMTMIEDLRTKPLYLNNTDAERARMDAIFEKDNKEYLDLLPEQMKATARVQDLERVVRTGVPVAPFVGKTDAWLGLALKRVITMAVDGGYDKVAFVNGKQSADRYNLSKQISKLRWDDATSGGISDADMNSPEGRGILYAYDLGGNKVMEKSIEHTELPDFVGKEVAQRLLSSAAKSARSSGSTGVRRRELSGLDLNVGGEGMITFYDKIVPNAVNALLKKVGGGKVAPVTISGASNGFDYYADGDRFTIVDGTNRFVTTRATAEEAAAMVDELNSKEQTQQPGFDVTDAMRDAAAQGLPMFSKRQVVGQNFTMPSMNAVDRARRVLQDDGLRMKRVIEAVKAKGGVVGEAQNFYDANTLMPGRIQAAMDEFKDNVIAPMAQKAAEFDIDFDELSLYAYAKHAKERNAYIASINKRFPDGGSGMTNADADQILADVAATGKQDQYDELHRDLMSITSTTRQVMLTDGLITEEEFDQLENAYENYIPLRGLENVDEETGAIRPGVGRGVNVRGGETLRALGRKSRAGDLIENAIRDYQRAIMRVEKNDVGKVLLDFVLSNPDPDLWGVDIERSKPSFDKKRGVVQYTTTIEKGEDTIGVKVGGQQVYIKFADKELTRALRQAWKDEVSGLERATLAVSGWWNNWLRNVLTRYNPVFAAINIPRDALWSGTTAALADLGPKGLARYFAAYGKALMASSRQEAGIAGTSNKLFGNPAMDKMFQEFRAAGGVTGGFYMKSLEDINTDLRTQLMLAGANPKSIAEIAKNNLWNQFPGMSKALQASGMSAGKANKLASYISASSAARTLEFLGSASENATRFALYIAARETGKTPVEAGLLAKNGTTNFNRKGEWGGALNNMYLFYNAAVQGTSQLLYVLRKPAVQTAMAGVAGTAAMLAFYGAAAGGEDDDGEAYWDKIPSYVKERNLVIMLPPGEALGDGMERVGKRGRYILVPVQYGFNIFPNMGYMIADVVRNQQDPRRGVTPTKAALHMTSVMFGSLNPFGGAVDLSDGVQVLLALAPTITDLPIQLANERGTFGTPSAPLPQRGNAGPDSERMFPSQMDGVPAKIAKALNELGGGNEAKAGSIMGVETSITPGTIQTIIGATTGGLGTFAEQITSSIVATTSDDKDLKANRIPFVNRFYGEVDEDANIRKAGDRMREVAKVSGEIIAQFEDGISVELSNEDQRMLSLAGAQEDYRKAMSEMRKEEIAVIESDMTEPEKKLVRQQINKARDELATVMNRVYLDTLKQQK